MYRLIKTINFFLVVFAFFSLVACNQDSNFEGNPIINSTDNIVSVTGDFSGVVVDSTTNQPIEGVSVSIANKTAKTSSDGAFFISDIIPGKYTVVYNKDGYFAKTKTNVEVNANQRKEDDPDAEYEVLKELLDAFVKYTESENFNWDAIILNDGSIVAADSSENSLEGNMQILHNAILTKYELNNYAYKYGITLGVQSLSPLNSTVKGSIKLLNGNYYAKEIVEGICPEGQNVNFIFDANGNDYQIYTTKTDAEGNFEISNLPANEEFLLMLDPIFDYSLQDTEYSYSGHSYGVKQFLIDDITDLIEFNTLANSTISLDILLYPVKDELIVLDSNTGFKNSLNSVLDVYDDVTITFSNVVNTDSVKFIFVEKDVELIASWDVEGKIATLKLPPEVCWNWGELPVSVTNAKNTIEITNTDKYDSVLDVNGTAFDLNYSSVNVYTEEKLSLEEVEFVTLNETPTRAASLNDNELPFRGSVKLTFNKEIDSENSDNQFEIYANSKKLGVADVAYADKIAYVYFDDLLTYAQNLSLNYTVYSTSSTSYNEDSVSDTVSFYTSDGLKLEKTNLYGDVFNVYYDFRDIKTDDLAVFPIDGKIELTFNEDLSDFTVEAEVYEKSSIWGISTVTELKKQNLVESLEIIGNKLVITIQNKLYDTDYALAVKISKDGLVYFNTRSEVFAYLNAFEEVGGSLTTNSKNPIIVVGNELENVDTSSYYVLFYAESREAKIIDTNMYNYILANNIPNSSEALIEPNDDIVLTFDKSIENCKIELALVPSVIANSFDEEDNLITGYVVDNNKLTISHKTLYADTEQALYVVITNTDGYEIYSSFGQNSDKIVAYNNNYIEFSTAEGLFVLEEYCDIALDNSTDDFPVYDKNGYDSTISLYFNDDLSKYNIEAKFLWSQEGQTTYESNAFFNFVNDAEKLKSQFIIEPQGTLVPGLYYTISLVLKDDNEEVLMDKNYSFKVSDNFVYRLPSLDAPIFTYPYSKVSKYTFDSTDKNLGLELPIIPYNYGKDNIYKIYSAKRITGTPDKYEWVLRSTVDQDSAYDLMYEGKYIDSVNLEDGFVSDISSSSWLVDGGSIAVMYQVINNFGLLEQSEIATYMDTTAPLLSFVFSPLEAKFYDEAENVEITVRSNIDEMIFIDDITSSISGYDIISGGYDTERKEYTFIVVVPAGCTVYADDYVRVSVYDMANNLGVRSMDIVE